VIHIIFTKRDQFQGVFIGTLAFCAFAVGFKLRHSAPHLGRGAVATQLECIREKEERRGDDS
jgi:hypothetical protein